MYDWEDTSLSSIEPDTLLQGRYRVIQSLSSGGFGETFQVLDEARLLSNGTYATKVLKVLNLNRFQDSTSRRKSIDLFRREAKVLSRLRHPGIPKVDIDGYFTWPDHASMPFHCLIMEYIEGRSLDAWLRLRDNRPLEQDLAIEWLQQLLSILNVIHSQGMIHRDIKPSNIMLTASGQLVLIDFGAVRDMTAAYFQNYGGSNTGTRIFAAGYTPHEQAEGRARAESDFFALGRTFVHLMTGIHPMGIDIDDNTGKLAWRECAPHISGWLADVLDRMTEMFPGNRPQNAQYILDQLKVTSLQISVQASYPVEQSQTHENQWPPSKKKISPDHWSNVRLKRVLQGHQDQIRGIVIHPDNTILVSSSFDSTLKLWALPEGQPISTLTGHSKRITTVAMSADGTVIASGGYDRHIRLWSLPDGELLHLIPRQADTIQALVFNPQKSTLVSATGTTIQQWSTQSGNLISVLPHRFRSIRSLALSPNGRLLAVGSLTGTVELWNINSRTRIWQTSYQLDGITSVNFSPNGRMLVCANGANMELLDLNKKRLGLLSSYQAGALSTTAFSPDGQVLASASGHCIELWSIAKKKRLSPPLTSHQKPIRTLAFTPNGRMLISAGADYKIILWQPAGT